MTFAFVPPTSRSYSIQLAGSSSLVYYFTRTPPCDRQVTYSSSFSYWAYAPYTYSISLSAGVPVFIVVDTNGAGNEGPFTLTIN